LKLLIDGQDDLLQINSEYQSEGFVARLDATLHSSGRVIGKAFLNQSEIDLETLQDKIIEGLDDQNVISIETISLKDNLRNGLNAVIEGLNQLEDQALEISDQMLRSGKLGMTELSVWAGDLAHMGTNINRFIHMFKISEQDLRLGDLSYKEGMAKMRYITSQIIGAIQNHKNLNISDLLQFEIAALISDLKNMIPTLIEELDKAKLD